MSKTIFITGSSTGLGRATALLFASRGWNVIATLRNPDAEKDLSRVPGITLLRLDVTDRRQIEEAAARALALGPVDVVLFERMGEPWARSLVTERPMPPVPLVSHITSRVVLAMCSMSSCISMTKQFASWG